jgi:hypothetical protein
MIPRLTSSWARACSFRAPSSFHMTSKSLSTTTWRAAAPGPSFPRFPYRPLNKRTTTQSLTVWPAGRRGFTSEKAKPGDKTPLNNASTQPTTTQLTQDRNKTDWAIIRQMMKYIWPKNDVGVKTRVVIALSLLVGGKVRVSGKRQCRTHTIL